MNFIVGMELSCADDDIAAEGDSLFPEAKAAEVRRTVLVSVAVGVGPVEVLAWLLAISAAVVVRSGEAESVEVEVRLRSWTLGSQPFSPVDM